MRRSCDERMAEYIAYYGALGYRVAHSEPFKGSRLVHMRLALAGPTA